MLSSLRILCSVALHYSLTRSCSILRASQRLTSYNSSEKAYLFLSMFSSRTIQCSSSRSLRVLTSSLISCSKCVCVVLTSLRPSSSLVLNSCSTRLTLRSSSVCLPKQMFRASAIIDNLRPKAIEFFRTWLVSWLKPPLSREMRSSSPSQLMLSKTSSSESQRVDYSTSTGKNRLMRFISSVCLLEWRARSDKQFQNQSPCWTRSQRGISSRSRTGENATFHLHEQQQMMMDQACPDSSPSSFSCAPTCVLTFSSSDMPHASPSSSFFCMTVETAKQATPTAIRPMQHSNTISSTGIRVILVTRNSTQNSSHRSTGCFRMTAASVQQPGTAQLTIVFTTKVSRNHNILKSDYSSASRQLPQLPQHFLLPACLQPPELPRQLLDIPSFLLRERVPGADELGLQGCCHGVVELEAGGIEPAAEERVGVDVLGGLDGELGPGDGLEGPDHINNGQLKMPSLARSTVCQPEKGWTSFAFTYLLFSTITSPSLFLSRLSPPVSCTGCQSKSGWPCRLRRLCPSISKMVRLWGRMVSLATSSRSSVAVRCRCSRVPASLSLIFSRTVRTRSFFLARIDLTCWGLSQWLTWIQKLCSLIQAGQPATLCDSSKNSCLSRSFSCSAASCPISTASTPGLLPQPLPASSPSNSQSKLSLCLLVRRARNLVFGLPLPLHQRLNTID